MVHTSSSLSAPADASGSKSVELAANNHRSVRDKDEALDPCRGNTVIALRNADQPQDGLIAFRTANDASVSADMRVNPAADKWDQTGLIRTINTYFHWSLIHRQAGVVLD